MIQKIKDVLTFIATVGGLGSWPFGCILGSIIAFPFLIIGRTIGANWIVALTLAAIGIFIILIFSYVNPQERSSIALSRMMGLLGALYKVPLTLKKIAFVFVLFHILSIISANLIAAPLFRRLRGDSYDADSVIKLLLSDALATLLTFGLWNLVRFFITF